MLTLLATGMAHAPLHWHLMLLLGLVMTGIFVYVVLVPYTKLKEAVAHEDWPRGGVALARIRQLVGTNLLLGAATIAVATLGRLVLHP